jgi:hypothetical protein
MSEDPNWVLELKRLSGVWKKKKTDNGSTVRSVTNQRPLIPWKNAPSGRIYQQERALRGALNDQLEYQERSTRCYKIRGRDEYDYGVTFNIDVGIFFSVSLPDNHHSKMYSYVPYSSANAGTRFGGSSAEICCSF